MATVEVDFHVVVKQRISSRGYTEGKPAVRVTKGKPACEHNEVAVAIHLELPVSLFKRPQLQARVVVNEADAPALITPEIQHNIAELVRDQLGIVLRIEAPEEPSA